MVFNPCCKDIGVQLFPNFWFVYVSFPSSTAVCSSAVRQEDAKIDAEVEYYV